MTIPREMQAMLLERAGTPLRAASLQVPEPGPARSSSRSPPAACAAPICTSSTASCRSPSFRSCSAMRSSATWRRSGRASWTSPSAIASACRGWASPTARASIAGSDQENLCDNPRFTGYQIDGGYAGYTVADARYAFKLPDVYSDAEAAPLLCAGLIGYRSLKLAGDPHRLGIYGFGAAAHIVAQVARAQGREVYAFTRPGDRQARDFALSLGAVWAGGSDAAPPQALDAAIIFAPVGALVPAALRAVRKGGVVVCGGIHMSDIPSFPYDILWEERVLRSVANLTRADAREFLALAPKLSVKTSVSPMPLSAANEALERLRRGELTGAAVLIA